MKTKILITGPPRCGKSTLIMKLIEYLQKDFKIYGFLTPEIKKNNKREGFYVEDIYSKKKFTLARIGDSNTNYKIGRYSVFIQDFDKYINELLELTEEVPDSIFCIDEIGKMELFSDLFQDFLKKLFKTKNLIIATIGQKLKHPIKEYIIAQSNIMLFNLNIHNRDEIFTEITSFLK